MVLRIEINIVYFKMICVNFIEIDDYGEFGWGMSDSVTL